MAEYIEREALYEKAYWNGEHPDVGNPLIECSWTKCGGDWVFCNQDCSDCTKCNFTATDRTEEGNNERAETVPVLWWRN